MLSNLTEDEQNAIRKNSVNCGYHWAYFRIADIPIAHSLTFNQKVNKEKINKCIEDQKIIPRIIHYLICNHTNLIKPISQIIVQYIGPLHSYFFELIFKDLNDKLRNLLYVPWWHNGFCTIIRYYNRSRQSWDLPLVDNINTKIELDALIRYNVNVNMNTNTPNDVKIVDFMKGVAELLSSDDGFNFPSNSCSDPLVIATQPLFKDMVNAKKLRKKNTIPQYLQQINQLKYQQKLMKSTTKSTMKRLDHSQHNKKYNIAYKITNNCKISYID